MKILGSISKALKGNAGKYITKGVGLAALGLCGIRCSLHRKTSS